MLIPEDQKAKSGNLPTHHCISDMVLFSVRGAVTTIAAPKLEVNLVPSPSSVILILEYLICITNCCC
jgi:hypothetical protein